MATVWVRLNVEAFGYPAGTVLGFDSTDRRRAMLLNANLATRANPPGGTPPVIGSPSPGGEMATDQEVADALAAALAGLGSSTGGAQRPVFPPPVSGSPVSNRAAGRGLTNTSTSLVSVTRVRHRITETCSGVALVFTGWGNNETNQPVDATIKAALELTVGGSQVIVPITFDGARTKTLTPGALLRSDLLGVNLRKGDVVWVRVMRTMASAASWIANCTLRGLTHGEGADSTGTDLVDAGTIAPSGGATPADGASAWTAHALVSPGCRGRSVAIVGDSISNGQNETVREDGGYMLRSLPDTVGVIRANNVSSTAAIYVGNSTNVSALRKRLPLLLAARAMWCEFGINDVNGGDSLATIKANLLRLWELGAAAGLPVYQSTLTPWSSSTDAWATTTGQTPFALGKHEVRIALNDWIRTKPAPLAGYFEVADVVETSRNSGVWRIPPSGTAPTTDGVHGSTEMHQLIAAAIAPAVAAAFT